MIYYFFKIYFSFFFFISLLFSQSLITDVVKDSDGRVDKVSFYREGTGSIELVKEKYYYKGGSVKKEVNYKQASIHGKLITYYPNGKKKSEKLYQLGEEKTAKFFNQNGVAMGSINLLGSWIVSDVPEIDDLPFNMGYMLEFMSNGKVVDSNNGKERDYLILNNELIFPRQVCKSTGIPLTAFISMDNGGFTLYMDPFQCPERSKGASTDEIWVRFSPLTDSIDNMIEKEFLLAQDLVKRLLPEVYSHVKDSDRYNQPKKSFSKSPFNGWDVLSKHNSMIDFGIDPGSVDAVLSQNWDLDISLYRDWIETNGRDSLYIWGLHVSIDHRKRSQDYHGFFNSISGESLFTFDMSESIKIDNDMRSKKIEINDGSTREVEASP